MRSALIILLAALLAIPVSVMAAADGLQTESTTFRSQPWIKLGARDWEGLKRDTWYFLGYQWVPIGILYMSPESVSGWTDEEKEAYDASEWWYNVTHPQIDSDDFYLNYILHPYWGAAYYVRARERGYGDPQAFWYSALLSSMYEFGAEALFEEVSIQDIFVTPIFGSLLGKYFMDVRDDIRDREVELGYRTTGDKWLWVLTDPLGALNSRLDRLTGRDASLQVRPFRSAPLNWDTEPVYGLEFRFEW